MVGHRSEAIDARIKTDASPGFQRIKGQTGSSSDPGDDSTNGRQTFGVIVRSLPVKLCNAELLGN